MPRSSVPSSNISPQEAGQVISASKLLNPMVDTCNALRNAFGGVILGPGGVNIPPAFNSRNIRLPYTEIPALSDDDEDHDTGSVVMIKWQGTATNTLIHDSNLSTLSLVAKPTVENQMFPIGIVTDKVTPDVVGKIIKTGYALARVKWETSDESLDPEDDDADKRYTEKTAGRLHVVDDITDPESNILRVSLGAGVCDIIWEDYDNDGDGTDDNDPTEEHWALVNINESLYSGAELLQVEDAEVDMDGTNYAKCKFIDTDGSAWGDEVLFRPQNNVAVSEKGFVKLGKSSTSPVITPLMVGAEERPVDQTYGEDDDGTDNEHPEAAIDENNYDVSIVDDDGSTQSVSVIWYRPEPPPAKDDDGTALDYPAKGVKITMSTGASYYDSGDEKLYGYVADFHFDSDGRLLYIERERRVSIDVPEDC